MAFLSLKSNNLHESSLSTTVILLGEKNLECVSDAAGGGGRKQKVADEKRVVSISTIKKNYLIKSSSLFHLSFFQLELASFFNVIIF